MSENDSPAHRKQLQPTWSHPYAPASALRSLSSAALSSTQASETLSLSSTVLTLQDRSVL
jgi:hypothetical protein